MTPKEYILGKIVSGRFLLTLIAGGVFAYLSCTGMLPAKDAQIIIGIVITFYFTKSRVDESPSESNGKPEDQNKTTKTTPPAPPPAE